MAGLLDQQRFGGTLLDPNPMTNPVPAAAQAQAPIWNTAAQLPIQAAQAWANWRLARLHDQANRSPQEATMDAAMGFTPMGMESALAGPIRAFHGSPYDFAKFDLGKIGTGEGAQTYGHGLYFAGNEAVAREYKATTAAAFNKRNWQPHADDFASRLLTDGGKTINGRYYSPDVRGKSMLASGIRAGSIVPDDLPPEMAALLAPESKGHMYEVNIAAEPHQLLDWDKPLREQPIQQQLKNVLPSYQIRDHQDASGAFIHSIIDADRAQAANTLKDAGIPGIQYLDQGSRAVGDGTRNYVIFNPEIISILRKYGIAPAALTGGAAATLGAQQEQ